jgi:hypothetical protein
MIAGGPPSRRWASHRTRGGQTQRGARLNGGPRSPRERLRPAPAITTPKKKLPGLPNPRSFMQFRSPRFPRPNHPHSAFSSSPCYNTAVCQSPNPNVNSRSALLKPTAVRRDCQFVARNAAVQSKPEAGNGRMTALVGSVRRGCAPAARPQATDVERRRSWHQSRGRSWAGEREKSPAWQSVS